MRWKAAVSRGKLKEVVDGYSLEFMTIYSLGDILFSVLDEEQMAYVNVLSHLIHNAHRYYGLRHQINFLDRDITVSLTSVHNQLHYLSVVSEILSELPSVNLDLPGNMSTYTVQRALDYDFD